MGANLECEIHRGNNGTNSTLCKNVNMCKMMENVSSKEKQMFLL